MSTSRTRAVVLVVVAALTAGVTSSAPAQGRPGGAGGGAGSAAGGGFQSGPFYAGPRVWLGNLNGAVAVGGQIERGFTQPGAFGPGIIAGGVGVDWYRWTPGYAYGEFRYTVVPIQAFGNYHFVIPSNRKLDPYVGLALVYSHYSTSYSGTDAGSGVTYASSTTDLAGQLGVRYFLTSDFGVQGQLGFGYGTLAIGAAWRF